MAEEAELVRRGFEALGRRDFQTLLAALDPQVRLRPMMEEGQTLNPDVRPVYKGTEGVMDFLATLADVFDGLRWEVGEVEEAGDGRVLVHARLRGMGKGSGAPVERPMAIVAEVREGRIVTLDAYSSPGEARERLGLA